MPRMRAVGRRRRDPRAGGRHHTPSACPARRSTRSTRAMRGHGGITHSPGPARRGRLAHGRGLHPGRGRQHRRLHRHLRPGRHRHDHRPVLGVAPTRSRSCASPARRRWPGCTRRTSRPSTSPPSPRPLTKMAMTVLEPAQVPGAFQQAFHLMRSGRPGPVLIDLPFDVQMAEIEFDPDTYEPLPVYKPAATRAQVEQGAGHAGRGRAAADRGRRRHHQRRRRATCWSSSPS